MWQRIDQHMNFLKVDELNSVKLEVELSDGVVIGEKIQDKKDRSGGITA